jgi:arsenate reductase
MTDRIYNALFLCTGNSARSIMAEKLLQHRGGGRFRAFSAGSFPTGKVNPLAIATLQRFNLDTGGLRSKSWDEFAAPGAPAMDFIFTVCDQAAGEVCPVWPGHPVTAHWGVPDPAAVQGTEAERMTAFADAARILDARLKNFTSLSIEKMDRLTLEMILRDIGSFESVQPR